MINKNFVIDIDGTITGDISNEEPEKMVTCLPFLDALETINDWHRNGHTITFFTARTDSHRKITEDWLKKHGFKYHNLIMNKPRGGNYHYIDNANVQATRYEGAFTELTTASRIIEVFQWHPNRSI